MVNLKNWPGIKERHEARDLKESYAGKITPDIADKIKTLNHNGATIISLQVVIAILLAIYVALDFRKPINGHTGKVLDKIGSAPVVEEDEKNKLYADALKIAKEKIADQFDESDKIADREMEHLLTKDGRLVQKSMHKKFEDDDKKFLLVTAIETEGQFQIKGSYAVNWHIDSTNLKIRLKTEDGYGEPLPCKKSIGLSVNLLKSLGVTHYVVIAPYSFKIEGIDSTFESEVAVVRPIPHSLMQD